MQFSANLGFLWAHLPLARAIEAAARAGFHAVECHWPYNVPAEEVRQALDRAGIEMVSLNTMRGAVEQGENGLAALAGREEEARAAIDQAIAYARAVRASAVHVMAGKASGREALRVFLGNLAYACDAAGADLNVLIEPLNPVSAPGYFLNGTEQAVEIIEAVGQPNLKIMFDFFHVQMLEGDVLQRFETLLPLVGHVQIAAVPDRGAPDHGEIDYAHILPAIADLGWHRPIGAEFRTEAGREPDLAWLERYRQKAGT